jgi:hypothetical protein
MIKMDPTICKRFFNKNESLFNTKDFYDVKIYVGIEPNIKEIHAHSFVCAHCPSFQNELTNAKKENGFYIIEKANIDEQVFKPILK